MFNWFLFIKEQEDDDYTLPTLASSMSADAEVYQDDSEKKIKNVSKIVKFWNKHIY